MITYRRGYRFDVSPDQLWDRIEEVDQFEGWWPWLTDFRLDGGGLSAGSVLYGVVNPPLPYRMRISVELVDCERPFAIDASDATPARTRKAAARAWKAAAPVAAGCPAPVPPGARGDFGRGGVDGRDATAGHAARQSDRPPGTAVGA